MRLGLNQERKTCRPGKSRVTSHDFFGSSSEKTERFRGANRRRKISRSSKSHKLHTQENINVEKTFQESQGRSARRVRVTDRWRRSHFGCGRLAVRSQDVGSDRND